MKWREVLGYDGMYEVSENGDVRGKRRRVNNKGLGMFVEGRILSQHVDRWGYKNVFLYKGGVAQCVKTHRAVAEAFLGAADGLQVNHIDGNKQNNSVKNLELCTGSENMHHAYATGLHSGGRPVVLAELGIRFSTIEAAARFVDGKHSGVRRCLSGRNKTHRGYHFLPAEEG